jgi:hypothetical protein
MMIELTANKECDEKKGSRPVLNAMALGERKALRVGGG